MRPTMCQLPPTYPLGMGYRLLIRRASGRDCYPDNLNDGIVHTMGKPVDKGDIGCGMAAIKTNLKLEDMNPTKVQIVMDMVKNLIPVGEGRAHSKAQMWARFRQFIDETIDRDGVVPIWHNDKMWELAKRNLGTLGGGRSDCLQAE